MVYPSPNDWPRLAKTASASRQMPVMTEAKSHLANSARRDGTRDKPQRAGRRPTTGKLERVAALVRSPRRLVYGFEHDLFGKPVSTFPDHALVAVSVVAASVDPLRPIGRPRLSPAAVVVTVVVGRAKEAEAMEAVMETIMEREPRRESTVAKSTMPKGSAGEMASSETAEVSPATHAATMHAASAAVATTAAATASRERRWRKRNRRSERGRGQATKELVIHLISPWLKCTTDAVARDHQENEMTRPFQLTKATDSDTGVRHVVIWRISKSAKACFMGRLHPHPRQRPSP
jgi:hypothetical protein